MLTWTNIAEASRKVSGRILMYPIDNNNNKAKPSIHKTRNSSERTWTFLRRHLQPLLRGAAR